MIPLHKKITFTLLLVLNLINVLLDEPLNEMGVIYTANFTLGLFLAGILLPKTESIEKPGASIAIFTAICLISLFNCDSIQTASYYLFILFAQGLCLFTICRMLSRRTKNGRTVFIAIILAISCFMMISAPGTNTIPISFPSSVIFIIEPRQVGLVLPFIWWGLMYCILWAGTWIYFRFVKSNAIRTD